MLVDIGLKLCCIIMTHLGDLEVKVTDLEILCQRFRVQVFISLYLLNMVMDQLDTLHVGRYLSEVLCCIINCQNHYCPVYLHLTIIVLKFQGDLQDKVLADDSLIEPVLLEVLRLYPPFLGGRRIVKKVSDFRK